MNNNRPHSSSDITGAERRPERSGNLHQTLGLDYRLFCVPDGIAAQLRQVDSMFFAGQHRVSKTIRSVGIVFVTDDRFQQLIAAIEYSLLDGIFLDENKCTCRDKNGKCENEFFHVNDATMC